MPLSTRSEEQPNVLSRGAQLICIASRLLPKVKIGRQRRNLGRLLRNVDALDVEQADSDFHVEEHLPVLLELGRLHLHAQQGADAVPPVVEGLLVGRVEVEEGVATVADEREGPLRVALAARVPGGPDDVRALGSGLELSDVRHLDLFLQALDGGRGSQFVAPFPVMKGLVVGTEFAEKELAPALGVGQPRAPLEVIQSLLPNEIEDF